MRAAPLGRLRSGEVVVSDPARVGAAVQQQLRRRSAGHRARRTTARCRARRPLALAPGSARRGRGRRGRAPPLATGWFARRGAVTAARLSIGRRRPRRRSACRRRSPRRRPRCRRRRPVARRAPRCHRCSPPRATPSRCAAGEAGVDVGARGHERGDLRRRLGHVPGPIGDDVQQRPRRSTPSAASIPPAARGRALPRCARGSPAGRRTSWRSRSTARRCRAPGRSSDGCCGPARWRGARRTPPPSG